MRRDPKRKLIVENPAQMAKKRSHCSPVDREDLSHLLPSINWWSSQKRRATYKTTRQTNMV